MRKAGLSAILFSVMLIFGTPAGAEKIVQHPAYLRALAELRDARAHVSPPAQENARDLPPHAGDPALNEASLPDGDEQRAIEEIDQALQDVKDASEDDGKGADDHAPVDVNWNRSERLHFAIDKLDQAHEDIELRQQDSYLKGLKANSAQEHLEKAKKAILHALGSPR